MAVKASATITLVRVNDGAAGKGIKSVVEKYAVSASNTTAPTSWSSTPPKMTATNRYLWNYEVTTYTDGSTSETSKRVIGVYGDKGATGSTGSAGKGISSITNYYLVTSASTGVTTSTSGWSTTPRTTTTTTKYLWNYEKITYTDSTSINTLPHIIGTHGATGATGAKGDKGDTGATGKGISSITEEYYLSTSKTTQTGGSWTTTPPTWSSGKYVWTRSKIVYTNPSSMSYTTPVCDSSWEAVNEIEVGGRNLVLASGVEHNSSVYNVHTYDLSEDWVTGAIYTLSIKGSIEDGSFGAWRDDGSKTISTFIPYNSEKDLYIYTFSCPAPYSDTHPTKRLAIYNYPSSATHDSTINWIKLEKGTQATDWTPAPEDNISTVDVEYYLSTSTSSLSGGSWQTVAPQWVNGKYMWSRVKTTYLDGTVKYSEPTCIAGAKGDTGPKGDKGETGAAGKGIKSITEHYAVSSSNSTAPTSWSTTVPTMTATNKYLWNYETITYTDNSTSTTAKRVIGAYGDKGATGGTGAAGNGIKSVVNYYLVSASSSGVTTSTSGWSTTPALTTTSKKYLWNYEKTTYTNGTTTNTTPHIIGTHGATGATGSKGDKGDTGDPGIDFSQGKMLHTDPMFLEGKNGANIYNNKANDTVAITREEKSEDNPFPAATHELVIKNTGTASPGLGGYNQGVYSRANAIFVSRIIAKIPVGYRIGAASNSLGSGYTREWLTDRAGTGKFKEYIYKYTCGASGTFSTGGHIYLEGASYGTPEEPVTWYVAYSTTFDMTDVSDVQNAQQSADNAQSSANNAQSSADESLSRVDAAESEIRQLADMIATIVTDGDGASMMTQTADGGWTFSIGSIIDSITNAQDKVNDISGEMDTANSNIDALQSALGDLGVLTDYVVITTYNNQPCIELGEKDSNFKLRITNTQIQFADGSVIPAYFTNQRMMIEQAEVKQELQFGGFVWKVRSNGNLGLVWKG